MRAGIHGAGIVIERVLNPPIAPARRFRGVLDTAFTIALGSVCAFALTLGPAPLNTVAASSATAASFAGLDSAPADGLLLPDEVGADPTTDQQRQAAEQRAAERSGTTPPATPPGSDATSQSPAEQAAPALPQAAQKPVQLPNPVDAAAALAIVEDFRTASGLAPFIDLDVCGSPLLHRILQVTTTGILPGGLTNLSLAPDPAHATADGNEPGPISVAVYTCE